MVMYIWDYFYNNTINSLKKQYFIKKYMKKAA